MSIRGKIAVALLLVTLIPLLSFAAAIFIFNKSQVERVGTVAQWQAQAALEASSRDLQRAVAEVRSWASTQGVAPRARQAADMTRAQLEARWQDNEYIYSPEAALLKQLRALSENRYAEIFFTDARGYVVASTNPTSDFGQGPEDDPLAGESWWAEAAANGVRVGELAFDERAGLYSIDISVALSDEQGFTGVLKAVYSVESMLDVIGQANVGRAGHTVLVNANGTVLAAPRRFRSIVFNPEVSMKETAAFELASGGKAGYRFDNIPWVGEALVGVASGQQMEESLASDWAVFLIVPVEAAMISARQVQKFGLFALALVAVVVMIAGFVLARRMSRPLQEISAAISHIEAGNLAVKVPYSEGSDEIAHLAKSINSMTDRLEQYDALNIDKIQSLTHELDNANRELTQLATHDSLTGLLNVRVFRERLTDEMKRSSRSSLPVSILLLDIDHFKKVNDTYGHQAGDAVLRKMGELLGGLVRTTDCAARYGGEEMAIILPETKGADAVKFAEKLRKLVMIEDFDIGDQNIQVTVSIGVAATDAVVETTIEGLIRHADEALYNAKGAGRNRVEVA